MTEQSVIINEACMSPKIIDKENKRIEILMAAMQVFARKGVANSKMADIAEVAGIGKGTIYEYFTSKEEIFALAFQYFFQDMMEKIDQVLEQTDDPVEKLKLIVDVSLHEFIESSGDLAGLMMDFWAEGVRRKDEQILETLDIKQIYQKYRSRLAAVMREGMKKAVFRQMDVISAAAVFIAAFDGIFLQWILEPGIIDIRKVSHVLLDSFLHGIIKTERKST
jgi:AcrR family transcriptional regulator